MGIRLIHGHSLPTSVTQHVSSLEQTAPMQKCGEDRLRREKGVAVMNTLLPPEETEDGLSHTIYNHGPTFKVEIKYPICRCCVQVVRSPSSFGQTCHSALLYNRSNSSLT